MEVNIAILAVAAGLLVIMGVFPVSLRLSVAALSDSRQATFATDVLGTIQGSTELLFKDWEAANRSEYDKVQDWINKDLLQIQLRNRFPLKGALKTLAFNSTPGTPGEIVGYFGDDNAYYLLEMHPSVVDPVAWQFSVKVTDAIEKKFLIDRQPAYTLEIRYRPPIP